MSRSLNIALAATLAGAVGAAWGAKEYPGCSPLVDTEFKTVTLVSRNGTNALEEPLKMAFDMDAAGVVDIYFVERKGKVRKYVGATKEIVTLGSVDANIEFEGGLAGIAMDPAFKTNKQIWLYYGHGTGDAFRFRVSRFTLNGAGMLDNASEKVVLAITAVAARLHTGGAMAFDAAGNLFITVGDNAAGEEGPGNTNDLRGKILRIKPKADGSGYDIPAGNLFSEGTAKTRAEIYIMGTRNAYSIALDPARPGWVGWGDVGPDGKGNAEEHNAATRAGNYGYPFYAGDQIPLITGGSAANPVNNNPKNTGLTALPPAIKATNAYPQAAAVTGPLFRYNGRSTATYKFPPHLDGMWFVTDFSKNAMDTVLLNPAGDTKVAVAQVFKNLRLDRPLDFQQGPDGAIYAINYSGWFNATASTAIVRLEYSGTCRPAVSIAGRALVPDRSSMSHRGLTLSVNHPGTYTLVVADMGGRKVASYRGENAGSHDLSAAVKGRTGLYTARLVTAAGSFSQKVMLSK